MFKKKSMMALLLASAMTLAACGGGGGGSAESSAADGGAAPAEGLTAEITVQAEKDWVPYYEAAVARVQETNPDAKITVKEVGAFDHLDTIDATDASNSDVADVFAIPADRLYTLSDNEVLGALDAPTMAEEIGGFTDFDGGLGGNFKIGDEYLAFPFNIESLIVFANKANAEKAGLDITKPVELNDVKYDEVLLPLFDAWYGVAATNSSNIELLGKKDDDTLYSDLTEEYGALPADKKATLDAIYDYWKKHNEAGTALFDAEAGWGYIDEAFKSGNTGALRLGGPWDTAAISALANDGADLEILPIDSITIAGKPLSHWKGGWGLVINSRIEEDAEKVALSRALIKEIVNPEYAVDLFKATGKVLENVPADTYASSDLPETDKKVIEATIASYDKSVARPLFTEWGQVWDTWKNAVLSWNSVKPADSEAGYKEIKASFDAMMTNIGK